MAKILIIEDEKDIANLIAFNLEREGFKTIKAFDGTQVLTITELQKPDLIILDLMLPGINGLDICKNIRANSRTATMPIIMLTAKSDETDKIIGLELGADDYVTKPFSVKELIARVRTILRRTKEQDMSLQKKTFEYKNLSINYASCAVWVHGYPINLSPIELKILFFLSRNPGRVFSRNQILQNVWGDDQFVTDRSVDVHIRRLRSQIEEDMENPRFILTVRGFGYKFADIER